MTNSSVGFVPTTEHPEAAAVKPIQQNVWRPVLQSITASKEKERNK